MISHFYSRVISRILDQALGGHIRALGVHNMTQEGIFALLAGILEENKPISIDAILLGHILFVLHTFNVLSKLRQELMKHD